jgi:hypothetical protein
VGEGNLTTMISNVDEVVRAIESLDDNYRVTSATPMEIYVTFNNIPLSGKRLVELQDTVRNIIKYEGMKSFIIRCKGGILKDE